MTILAITDIPRMTDLFERLAQQHQGLVVASEIHRGIERLESLQPEVVIIQNHLAGLSADILHKHIKSRLGRRKVRFALISAPHLLDVGLSTRFELILDPTLADEQLEQVMQKLFTDQNSTSGSTQQADQITPDQPTLPEQQLIADRTAFASNQDGHLPTPLTYTLPTRPGVKIDSDFSKQLDSTTNDLQPDPPPCAYREQELRVRDLHRVPHLIDDQDTPQPWYLRTGVLLVMATLIVVVAVSLYQNRTASKNTREQPVPNVQTSSKAATPPAPPMPAPVTSTTRQPLPSHGEGRPRTLPGFIPKECLDPGYGKDNPGWSSYRGQTSEYRIFREKDGTIKAIQVIDRSGAGIQEGFYTSVLKEVAGAAAMRSTSSEIKEGYEVRHGEVAGLQLVQYRDAQGGRMRGFVITWP
jgi:hypothetical protein